MGTRMVLVVMGRVECLRHEGGSPPASPMPGIGPGPGIDYMALEWGLGWYQPSRDARGRSPRTVMWTRN